MLFRGTRSLLLACAVICFICLVAWVPSSSAQSATAQVVGRVEDAQGGLISGAKVAMVETLKDARHETTTDSEGRYTLTNLPVGPYKFEVSKDGFKTYSQSGIILQVDDHIELPAKLEVGAAAQVIEVTAGATMVQTETASISNVIDSQRINDLPLNGRFASQLIVLSGAAVQFQGQTATSGFGDLTGSKSFYSSFAISVAGSALNGTNYLLDGGDNVDTYSNVNLPFPFPDALQEFSVETSALPARSGLHPGGVVNVVTKSGTNQFHGDAFDYLRNGVFNARSYFSPTQDAVHRNQFGFTAGDKILKDKLFFFAGYQGLKLTNIGTQQTSVPTAAMWAGDFTAYVNGGCGNITTLSTSVAPSQGIAGIPLFNIAPGAVTTFSNNNTTNNPPLTSNSSIKNVTLGSATTGLITLNPLFAFNPSSLALQKFIPAAGATFNGAPNPCGNINYPLPTINNGNEEIGRVDYIINSKHTVFGRYYVNDFASPPPFIPTNLIITQNPGLAQRAQTFTLGDTYAISPTKINSFHFTWNRRRDNRGVDPRDINPTAPISAGGLGINEFNFLGNFFLISAISGGTSGFVIGCGTCATGHFNVNGIQAADDFDFIHGKHHFAFGVDVHHSQNNTVSGFDGNGTFAFAGSTTFNAGLNYASTGIGMGDFLLGNYSGYSFSRPQTINYAATMPGVYFQDTYRMTNSLTITAGLRWEPSLYPTDEFNRGALFNMQNFLNDVHSQVYPQAPAGAQYYGDPGVPRSFAADHLTNFSPRLGVAWSPGGKRNQVIRAGAGVFYDSTEIWYAQRQSSDPPFVDEVDNGAGCGTLSNPWLNFQFPLATGASECSAATAGKNNNPFPGVQAFPANALWIVLPPNWKPEYVINWNASYQIEFAKDWLFSASYIGNKTTHASLGVDINYPETNFANTSGNTNFCGTFSPSAGCTTGNENARRVLAIAAAASGKPDLVTSAGQYGILTSIDDGANANYNGLLVTVRHRFAHGFTLLSNYTWSHCLDYGEFSGDVTGTAYVNQISRKADYGSCGTIDIRNILHNSLIVQSPFHEGGWKGQLLGHWQLSTTISAQSGLPVNVTTGVDSSLTGEGAQRVNVVPGVSPYLPKTLLTSGANVGKVQFFNPAAFTQLSAAGGIGGTVCNPPPPATPPASCALTGILGNVGRNTLRAPGAVNIDASLSRIFDIHERLNLEFRAEAFNLINHWNPTAPGSGLNSAAFGTVGSAPSPGLIPSLFDPRVMQFALKLHW